MCFGRKDAQPVPEIATPRPVQPGYVVGQEQGQRSTAGRPVENRTAERSRPPKPPAAGSRPHTWAGQLNATGPQQSSGPPAGAGAGKSHSPSLQPGADGDSRPQASPGQATAAESPEGIPTVAE
jgi:hypothetical protein